MHENVSLDFMAHSAAPKRSKSKSSSGKAPERNAGSASKGSVSGGSGGFWRNWVFPVFYWAAIAIAGYLLLCSVFLILLRWVDPLFTAVQMQRRVESWFEPGSYSKQRDQVDISAMSPALRRAVVAAEDAKFYQHEGIDWQVIEELIEDDLDGLKVSRGGSTITQQLIKNLFFTTHRSWIRKGIEFALVPLAERVLKKDRILEIYLNNIEWGPGVFGAEAAARYHYGVAASKLTRDQSARLAAIVPAPRRWKPQRMGRRAAVIDLRVRQMVWP